jgi:hypothetical protein
LLCNLLDGMLAVEEGPRARPATSQRSSGSPADIFILLGVGYSAQISHTA